MLRYLAVAPLVAILEQRHALPPSLPPAYAHECALLADWDCRQPDPSHTPDKRAYKTRRLILIRCVLPLLVV
jgi:hypothetical protein